jgi:chromate transporter
LRNIGVAGALRGMSCRNLRADFATGLNVLHSIIPLTRRLALLFSALCFVCVALLKLPLVYVLLGLGAISWALVFRKLK